MDNSPVVRQNVRLLFYAFFTQLIQTRFAKIQMLELWGLRAAHCNKPCTGRIWLPEMTQMKQNNHAIGRNRRICAPAGGNALSNFISSLCRSAFKSTSCVNDSTTQRARGVSRIRYWTITHNSGQLGFGRSDAHFDHIHVLRFALSS